MREAPHPVHGSQEDQAYIDAVETRRAASLRKRVMWCCIIGMFFMMIAVLGHGMELVGLRMEAGKHASDEAAAAAHPPTTPPSDPTAAVRRWEGLYPSTVVHFVSTAMVVALCIWVLIYTIRTRPFSQTEAARCGPRVLPGRHRLVIALSWLALGEMVIAIPAELIAQWVDLNHGPLSAVAKVSEEPANAGYTATNAYGLFYFLACVFVPMRWTESLRIALPGLFVLGGSVAFLPIEPWYAKLGFVVLALAYTLMFSAWSAWRFADFDARLRAHALGDRYTDLSDQVSAISAELTEARRLHESLFPALSVLQGHPDTPVRIGFRYEPARQIGGDFLDVYREPPRAAGSGVPVASGVTVVVIDVSGHGVTAALAVNRLHGELRRFFARYPRAERSTPGAPGGPGHLLTELNSYTCAALAEQGVFATALVVHVAPDPTGAGTIHWASAGHPTGFLAHTDGTVTDLESTSTMLGVLPPDLFDAREQAAPMRPGDHLITYTDGAVESRDARGQDYTPQRLRTRIAELALSSNAGTLLDGLMEAVRTHRHGRITDDTLLVEVSVGIDDPIVAGSAGNASPTSESTGYTRA